ncbi:ependymin-1-like [Eucyclogobius newberryi]|uniref:ependymin-1-like n=1 Tax=Eucyclogobius newberryi TaxID=166745 RepID=UPI003B5C0372
MKPVLGFACFLGLSLAASLERRPKQCQSPPLLTGGFTFSTQNEKIWFMAGYEYDAFQQRIRIYESGIYNNQSFIYDILLLYKEGVMYEINHKASTCTKKPLDVDFKPMGVPPNASLVGQYVVGSSSGPGEGLLVDTWGGKTPKGGQYMVTVTDSGCVPVSTVMHTRDFGWVVVSYFNNVKGIIMPDALNPPPFCPGQEAKPEGPPLDFFTVINNLRESAE